MSRQTYRFLLRVFGWVAAGLATVAAVLLLLLAAYVAFYDYPEQLQSWTETEAERILGRPVEIGDIYVDLPRFAFELRQVVVPARPGGETPPVLELRRVRGTLRLSSIFLTQLHLQRLEVEGLVVRVYDRGDGRRELAGPWASTPDGRPGRSLVPGAGMGFLADQILLSDSTFIYDNRSVPWRLDAEAVELGLRRREDSGYEGTLSYRAGTLAIKDRAPIRSSLDARVELGGRSLRVEELSAEGDFFDIRARGTVHLDRTARAELAVEASGDVAAFATLWLPWPLRDAEPPRPASFRGKLSVDEGGHLAEGTFEIPEARVSGLSLRDWSGQVHWDSQRLELRSASGRIGAGSAQLELEQALGPDPEPARMVLRWDGLVLDEVARALVGGSLPLAARLSGEAELTLPGGGAGSASGTFVLTGAGIGGRAETLPLDLAAKGRLSEGSLDLESAILSTPSTELHLAGTYSRDGNTDVEVGLDTSQLLEVDRLQRELRAVLRPEGDHRLLGLDGTARVRGRLTGSLDELSFRGEARAERLGFEGVGWGTLEAKGSLAEGRLRIEELRARRDDAALSGRGEMTLPDGAGADLDLRFRFERWPMRDLERAFRSGQYLGFLRHPVPLDGSLSGEGAIARRGGALEGEAEVELGGGSLGGVPLGDGQGRARFSGRELHLASLAFSHGRARLEGGLRLHLDAQHLSGRLAGSALSLSDLVGGERGLEGEAAAAIEIGGTLADPEWRLEARAPALVLGGSDLGAATLRAAAGEGVLEAALNVEGKGFQFEAEASGELADGYPLRGRARFRGAELGAWLRSVGSEVPASLRWTANGQASFDGMLARPKSFAAEARLTSVAMEIAEQRLVALRPVLIRIEQGELLVDDLRLVGENTELGLAGTLSLGAGEIDLEARGAVDLGLLGTLYPAVESAGAADLSARIRGAWEAPSLSGHADLSAGTLRVRDFPQAFGDVNGRILFDNRTVRVAALTARFGGAAVRLGGALRLRGFAPESFDLRLEGSGLRLRYPEGFVATLDAELSLTGTAAAQVLSGRIDVTEASWTRDYDLAAGFLVSRQGLPLLDELEGESPLSGIRLDIEVNAPRGIHVKNSLARLEASADLQLRGTFARPTLLGRSEALGGELFLLGQQYDVLSGRVDFLDPSGIKPFFDLVAETRVRSYRVELRLRGTADQFHPELVSDPPLRTIDILRLLAGATEREILVGSEEEELAGVGVASLLTERLSQEVGKRAERLFGLDRFSIDPFLVGQFANPTARVSLGKRISRDISIRYSSNLTSTTESIVLIEYTPEGPVSWIISRDETGALGVDVKFRKSF